MRAINYNSTPAPVTILMTEMDSDGYPYYMDDVDGDYEGDKALIPIGSIIYYLPTNEKMIIADHTIYNDEVLLLCQVIGTEEFFFINSNRQYLQPENLSEPEPTPTPGDDNPTVTK